VGKEMLWKMGYEVLSATGGREARPREYGHPGPDHARSQRGGDL
jgi:hypothetical protein